MLDELLEKCSDAKRILRELGGIAEKDIEVQSIIAEKEYPFTVQVWYKVTNKEGEEIYLEKNIEGIAYYSMIEELLKCKHIDEKTKNALKKEIEEFNKVWNEYIRDP